MQKARNPAPLVQLHLPAMNRPIPALLVSLCLSGPALAQGSVSQSPVDIDLVWSTFAPHDAAVDAPPKDAGRGPLEPEQVAAERRLLAQRGVPPTGAGGGTYGSIPNDLCANATSGKRISAINASRSRSFTLRLVMAEKSVTPSWYSHFIS